MRLLQSASEDDMIAVFLAAETASQRYGPQIREILARLGQPHAIAAHPDTSDAAANAIRRQVLAAYRGYPAADVFTGMPADVAWHHAALTPAELGVEECNPRARGPYERLGYLDYGRESSSWDEEAQADPSPVIRRYAR